MHVGALVENIDNSLVCDSPIVSNWAHSCFGWLTCLRVIAWSGACCTSLILALKYMSMCSLLTLCLTASGSYVKCVCHKNTFHINLFSPLVETLALMNHNPSEKRESVTQNCSVWKSLSSSSRLWRLFRAALDGKGFACLLDNCPLLSPYSRASVLLRPDALSDALDQQCRAEQRVHGWWGHDWTRDNFHQNEPQGGTTYRDYIRLYFKVFQLYSSSLSLLLKSPFDDRLDSLRIVWFVIHSVACL